MKKEEFIKRWGIKAYEKWQKQVSDWKYFNSKKVRNYSRKSGLIHRVRNSIRDKYSRNWKKYKHIIAPASRLYYLWTPETDKCKCAGLVEAEQSQYPFKDVIHIPVIHRAQILETLISKHLIPKFLMRKFERPIPVFTDEELLDIMSMEETR